MKQGTDLVQLKILESYLSVIVSHIRNFHLLVQASKITVEKLKKQTKYRKEKIAKMHKEIGWNVYSITFLIERILKIYNIGGEEYYVGQFNGARFRKMLDNIEVVWRKKEDYD